MILESKVDDRLEHLNLELKEDKDDLHDDLKYMEFLDSRIKTVETNLSSQLQDLQANFNNQLNDIRFQVGSSGMP